MKSPRKISVVARVLGCDQQTLRRYDRLGLFMPRRDRLGNRIYDDEDVEVLRGIKASRKPGRPPKDPTAPAPKRKRAPERGRAQRAAEGAP